MTHWKTFPDPGIKNITLAVRLKQIAQSLSDSLVQQMKTTCHNGKYWRKGNRGKQDSVCLQQGISKHTVSTCRALQWHAHILTKPRLWEQTLSKRATDWSHTLEIDGQLIELVLKSSRPAPEKSSPPFYFHLPFISAASLWSLYASF